MASGQNDSTFNSFNHTSITTTDLFGNPLAGYEDAVDYYKKIAEKNYLFLTEFVDAFNNLFERYEKFLVERKLGDLSTWKFEWETTLTNKTFYEMRSSVFLKNYHETQKNLLRFLNILPKEMTMLYGGYGFVSSLQDYHPSIPIAVLLRSQTKATLPQNKFLRTFVSGKPRMSYMIIQNLGYYEELEEQGRQNEVLFMLRSLVKRAYGDPFS